MRALKPHVAVHANGSFPFVLGGEERLRAHEAIRALTTIANGPGVEATMQEDVQLADWVRRDPSLFVESIPQENSFGALGGNGWGVNRSWWGTWAYKAAVNGFIHSVRALFDAGVHPDDGQIFMRRVIWLPNWNSNPSRLAMVLSRNANPDVIEQLEKPGGFRANPNRSVLRQCLRRISAAATSVWRPLPGSTSDSNGKLERNLGHVADMREAIACARLLLRAGARRLDPVDHDVLCDDGDVIEPVHSGASAIGVLIVSLCQLDDVHGDRGLLEEFIREVHAAGANVNRPSGNDQLPPVIRAIRRKDISAVRLLIDLGASGKDADLVRPACRLESGKTLCSIATLTQEAERAGGDELKAEVMEALMLHVTGSSKAPAPAPAARRNSRATV